jgi:hypothetical protein
MLLQVVTGARLEAFEDFSIGFLDLYITLWMSNERIAGELECIAGILGMHWNASRILLSLSLECIAGELGPIVSNDPVWDPTPADDGLDKLDYGLLVDLDHRGCFRPLGELVDGDIQISESSDGLGERT